MPLRIDVHGLRITDGECAWPFEVDCLLDHARVELNGVNYLLHLLTWRDKQVLARLSVLGEEFLKREFVRLSLRKSAPLPAGKHDLSLLLELATWYNSPDDPEVLPFDPVTLSRVTMELCLRLKLPPEHLDQRSANEIERFWRVAATSQAPAEEITDSPPRHSVAMESRKATKIVIVPDSPAPKSTATAQMSSPNFKDEFSAAETSAQTTFIPTQTSPLKTDTSPKSIDTDNKQADKLEFTEFSPVSSDSNPLPRSVQRSSDAWSPQGNHFRSESLPPNSIKSIFDHTELPNATSLLPDSIGSISGESPVKERYSPDLPVDTRPLTDFGVRDSRTLLTTLPRASLPGASHSWTNGLEQHSPPPAAEESASAADLSDVENIFDELTERVAQSAMQLGIDVEY